MVPAAFASEGTAGGHSLCPLMREQTVAGVLWLLLTEEHSTKDEAVPVCAFEERLPAADQRQRRSAS